MIRGLGLEGRHGLVTGAGSDIGQACVQRLRNIESVFDAYRVTPTN